MRTQLKSRSYGGSSRKIAAARAAVGRANAVLSTRGSMSSRGFGSSLSRGYFGGRPELKYVDVTNTNIALTTTWAVAHINPIAQGTDNNSRIGRQAMMKSIIFNGNCFNLATASLNAFNGAYCRFVIIYDKQPNSPAGSTPPSGLDVFVLNDPNSPMNLNNRDRFEVILDVRKQVSAFLMNATPALAAGSPGNSYFKKYRKLNKEIIFSNTGAPLVNISTGAMYIYVIADAAVAALDYYTRIRFTDQ